MLTNIFFCFFSLLSFHVFFIFSICFVSQKSNNKKHSDDPFDCPDCNLESELIACGSECILFTELCPFKMQVHGRYCSQCNKSWDFDGLNKKIYNVNNKIAFTHSLLNGYTSAINKCATAMNSYLTGFRRKYVHRLILLYFVFLVSCFVIILFCYYFVL